MKILLTLAQKKNLYKNLHTHYSVLHNIYIQTL